METTKFKNYSVFITRNLSDTGNFPEFCKVNHFDLSGKAGITIKFRKFDLPTHFDAIFFGSKNAVDSFFQFHTLSKEIKIACVGSKTASAIQHTGFKPTFIAESVIESELKRFKIWALDSIVFFPVSDKSLYTFSAILNPKNSLTEIAYETNLISLESENLSADIIVFTSPSNVESISKTKTIFQNQHVIFWGESSAKAGITLLQINSFTTLEKPSFDALEKTIRLIGN